MAGMEQENIFDTVLGVADSPNNGNSPPVPDLDDPFSFFSSSELASQPSIELTPVYDFNPLEVLQFNRWEALAYDLALDKAPIDYVAQAYNIDLDDLELLMEDSYFSKILGEKKTEIKLLGPDAEQVVKFRVIASEAIPMYLQRLNSIDTSSREFHSMFKTAIDLARLAPVDEDGEIVANTGGNEVTININGIPGLEHLQPKTVTPEAEVVEVITGESE